eukprot:TRINITY_DN2206_c0_g1_i2.p1 TRINITY_DN2206_c0_g1~~TRINITY_DN2206_c0_g1_i2.p1  ORF type:complete len:160 (-),score=24.42 TRINITY_DN2206_c0_g1_i2:551-991(-)
MNQPPSSPRYPSLRQSLYSQLQIMPESLMETQIREMSDKLEIERAERLALEQEMKQLSEMLYSTSQARKAMEECLLDMERELQHLMNGEGTQSIIAEKKLARLLTPRELDELYALMIDPNVGCQIGDQKFFGVKFKQVLKGDHSRI